MLSDVHDGTLATSVAVPRQNLVPKPAALSFEEAACLPTAWLTAYRMLFRHANVLPGATVLVQGAGGGVATAVIMLGAAAGLRVWATSRSEEKRTRAVALGAEQAFETGARLPSASTRCSRRWARQRGRTRSRCSSRGHDRPRGHDHRRRPAGGTSPDLHDEAPGGRDDARHARRSSICSHASARNRGFTRRSNRVIPL